MEGNIVYKETHLVTQMPIKDKMEYKIIESTEYFKEMMIKQYEIKLKIK